MEKYRPDLHFVYPAAIDGHMIAPKQVHRDPLNAEYPFYDTSRAFRFKAWWMHLFISTVGVAVSSIRYGVRVRGRKNFRKYRALLKHGAITVCNHVFDWDYFLVRRAIFPRHEFVTIWKNNLLATYGPGLRLTGGIPIPAGDLAAMRRLDRDLLRLLADGHWLHFYPEASMWYYEENLRPFKKGAFSYAVRADKPVIPLAISYRPARGIYRLFKGKYPLCTISIGAPIMPDQKLPRDEAVEKLRHQAERAVAEQMVRYTADLRTKDLHHEKNGQKGS